MNIETTKQSPAASYEEQRRQRRYEAAARVEELAAIAKQVVLDLRGELDATAVGHLRANDTAYARVYWLRRELGRVVAELGVGLPNHRVMKAVEKEYGDEAGWSTPVNRKEA